MIVVVVLSVVAAAVVEVEVVVVVGVLVAVVPAVIHKVHIEILQWQMSPAMFPFTTRGKPQFSCGKSIYSC